MEDKQGYFKLPDCILRKSDYEIFYLNPEDNTYSMRGSMGTHTFEQLIIKNPSSFTILEDDTEVRMVVERGDKITLNGVECEIKNRSEIHITFADYLKAKKS